MNKEHTHLNSEGDFKSDKYPWSPEGFFALKFTDSIAQEAILLYAEKTTDKKLARDLKIAVGNARKEKRA